jgi:hypothetical protein
MSLSYVLLEDGTKQYKFTSETTINLTNTDIFAPTSAILGRIKVNITGDASTADGEYYVNVVPASGNTAWNTLSPGLYAGSTDCMEYVGKTTLNGVTYYGMKNAVYCAMVSLDSATISTVTVAIDDITMKVIKYNSATNAIETVTYTIPAKSITQLKQTSAFFSVNIPKVADDLILAISFE